jgi:4-amino-4-deoxy-L-arabinose transferase-like glycosyltransferase
VYLAMGLVVRIRAGAGRWRTYVALGLVLGSGYLVKAVLFPMAFVFLAVAFLSGRPPGRSAARTLVALALFVLVAGPWVALLSRSKGRLTWGDTARINYACHVNGIHPWDHWRGEPPGSGTPAHPSRQILDSPAVYEFAMPVIGSYPLWYDPSYWYEGVTPTFDLAQQWGVLRAHLGFYFDFFFVRQGGVVFPFLILLIMARRWWRSLSDLLVYWWLLLPALAGLGVYALVHVEDRYIAPFVVLLWGGLFAAVRLPRSPESRRLVRYVSGVSLLSIVLMVGSHALPAVERTARDLRWRMDTAPHRQWQIAETLQKMGLEPGDKVAHIGQALKSWSYWARLADVQIVAELRPDDSFWLADDATRADVLDCFRDVGAVAVIARRWPTNERPFGLPVAFAPHFERIGKTDHYVRFLRVPVTTRPPATQPQSSPDNSVSRPD